MWPRVQSAAEAMVQGSYAIASGCIGPLTHLPWYVIANCSLGSLMKRGRNIPSTCYQKSLVLFMHVAPTLLQRHPDVSTSDGINVLLVQWTVDVSPHFHMYINSHMQIRSQETRDTGQDTWCGTQLPLHRHMGPLISASC